MHSKHVFTQFLTSPRTPADSGPQTEVLPEYPAYRENERERERQSKSESVQIKTKRDSGKDIKQKGKQG